MRTNPALPEDRPLDSPHISADERQALLNLHKKQNGEEVEFVNIADARALTERGLAVRTQQGWTITEAGVRLLTGDASAPSAANTAPSSVTPFAAKLD